MRSHLQAQQQATQAQSLSTSHTVRSSCFLAANNRQITKMFGIYLLLAKWCLACSPVGHILANLLQRLHQGELLLL